VSTASGLHCLATAFEHGHVRGGGGRASRVGGGPSNRGAAEGDAREGAERVNDLT
jgi:hypothetical protein